MDDDLRVIAAAGGERLRLVLNAPKRNALTLALIEQIRAALGAVSDHGHLRLVTLESAHADFSVGSSIEEHRPEVIDRALPPFHQLIRDLLKTEAVTAAVVRGRCLGGGFELALACDLIVAAEDAVLGLPEINLGVFPPPASVLLPLRVGASRATAAILTGEAQSASTWREYGLLLSVVPSDRLEDEVSDWHRRYLSPRSAAALRHAAVASRLHLVQAAEHLLPRAERLYLDQLMRTHDAGEGILAFLEKRPPKWEDR
ncbi:MAG: enoyl-CoA hydratase/isomerase family protein [Acidobacteria bacterium]|nr:enoyl-CoA hydratase/isomerase family protein [Acidobacteriota bacterium]